MKENVGSAIVFTICMTMLNFSSQNQIVISNKHGKDGNDCGKQNPCATLYYALTERMLDLGVNYILLDNSYEEKSVYLINQTILINNSFILTSQFENLDKPVIKSFNQDLPIFQFIENRMYNLQISNIAFLDSSILTFSSLGSITFRDCYFINLVKFLYCDDPASIIVSIDTCRFTGSNNYMKTALIQISAFRNFNLLIQHSVFDHTNNWEIINTAKINSSLDLKVYDTQLIGISLNKLNKPDIFIQIYNEHTHGNVDIKTTLFREKHIKIVHSNLISIWDSIFESNNGYPQLEIASQKVGQKIIGSFNIKKTTFKNSVTGALSIQSCYKGSIVGCHFENNAQNNYYRAGGAIENNNCFLSIEGCTFKDNSALSNGGTISSVSFDYYLQIKDTVITGPKDTSSLLGNIIYCPTSVSLNNVQIDASLSVQSTNPYVVLGSLEMLAYNENFTFNCPINSDIFIYKTASRSEHLLSSIIFYCKPCVKGTYSLLQGSAFYYATDSFPKFITLNIKCIPCPTSGICNGRLRCKDNFWGYKLYSDPKYLAFKHCPPYYCCSSYGKPCTTINTCEENRHGILCGSCKKGYSESYIGNKCVPNSSCNNNWFWILYILIIAISVSGILYLRDTFSFIKRRFEKPEIPHQLEEQLLSNNTVEDLRLINSDENLLNESFEDENNLSDITDECISTDDNFETMSNKSTNVDNNKYNNLFSGFIKITFFFYQAERLLRVQTSAKNQYHLPMFLHDMLSSFFNFQIDLNHQKNTVCPIVGLTAVGKEFIKVSTVIATFTIFFFLYLCHKIYKKFRTDHIRVGPGFQKSFGIRIKYGFIQLTLLGFSILAMFAFKTTNCVSIMNKNHLYIQGDLQCFKLWQKMIFAYLAMWIIPFPAALYFGSYYLQSFKLSANAFIQGLIFPPLGMFYCIRSLFVEANLSDQQIDVSKYFLQVIYEPYRKRRHSKTEGEQVNTENDFLLWESILILRRLVMTIVVVFVQHPVNRLYILLLMLVVFSFSHYKVQPFEAPCLNDLETFSLSVLCCLSAINIFWAYTEEFDLLNNPHLYTTGYIFLCLELIILLLPVLVLVSYGVFLCIKCCIKKIIKKYISKHD